MNLSYFLLACLILLFPPITTTAVMRAVERLRTDVNRINPFYRLTMNIYHGNYKFSQPERNKVGKNFQPKQRKFKRQKFAKRPPLLKSLQRARKRIPVGNTNNFGNIVYRQFWETGLCSDGNSRCSEIRGSRHVPSCQAATIFLMRACSARPGRLSNSSHPQIL